MQLIQTTIETAHSKLKGHIDDLNQVLYALEVVKREKNPKRLRILQETVNQLSQYLVRGVLDVGLEINRDCEALLSLQESELNKIKNDTTHQNGRPPKAQTHSTKC